MTDIARTAVWIAENIREARQKICMAYELRDEDRAAADWLRDMAKMHLDLNARGHEIIAAKIAAASKEHANEPALPGMQLAHKWSHGKMVREAAEVSAMIAGYK